MLKAVLFDLDRTLTDTLADIAAAMNRSLRLHGLPEWPVDAYRYLVGDGAKTLSERCVRERLELVVEPPAILRGIPITVITALLMLLALSGFVGVRL